MSDMRCMTQDAATCNSLAQVICTNQNIPKNESREYTSSTEPVLKGFLLCTLFIFMYYYDFTMRGDPNIM